MRVVGARGVTATVMGMNEEGGIPSGDSIDAGASAEALTELTAAAAVSVTDSSVAFEPS